VRRNWLVLTGLLAVAGTARAEEPSLLAPALPREMTRLRGNVRPFLSVLDRGGGVLAELAVDHYFRSPWRLSLELAPLALAIQPGGSGTIGHVRVGGAYAGDFIELGLSAGSRVQNFGAAGISLAAFVRLGALDGLNLTVTSGYVWKRNRYTGRATVGLGSMSGALTVPLSPRFALFAEGAFSSDPWLYFSAGLRHRLSGEGGSGSWFLAGSLGLAWVVDRPDCPYPDTGWCTGSAWAAGPTVGLGLERRF
jgi:hypothetical protein